VEKENSVVSAHILCVYEEGCSLQPLITEFQYFRLKSI
jgi:hypothetical protein